MATSKTEPKIQLGQPVIYTDRKGREKAAIVIGTSASVQSGGHGVPPLETGELHLAVFSPAGTCYSRQSVIRADEPLADTGSWRPLPS